MEQEIVNVSIARIRQNHPTMKGIGDDFAIDHSEFYVEEEMTSFLKFPLRVDGLIIAVREKGSTSININLREYELKEHDLMICSVGDIIQSDVRAGIHHSQTMMISDNFLKEMYIDLNSFMPLFISLKDVPIFHLTDEEVQQLSAYFHLLEELVESEDKFRKETARRLLGAYLYKLGSILHRKHPVTEEEPKSVKREELQFKQFISLLAEHHRKERRVDFYAEQLFLSPKHFSTVIKKVSGKTAGEWIDEYVILEAKALLKYSTMSIQEVAYFLNFPNPSFFGKYFKHHAGMSPSEYKMQ